MIVDINNYDGNLLHNRFAYTFFKKRTLPIGNIITFRGPMLVEADGMIDHEDVLNNDYIYSDDAYYLIYQHKILVFNWVLVLCCGYWITYLDILIWN